MLAHIAGIPVEETALSLAPAAFAVAGLTSARLRRLAHQRRRRGSSRYPAKSSTAEGGRA